MCAAAASSSTSSASNACLTPPCPVCGYDLRGTVEAGEKACPECGWEFTAADLALLGPSDLKGEPKSLKSAESRMSGPLLLIILAIISVIFVVTALILTRA